MMVVQRIYTVEDRGRCPLGEGEIVLEYLRGSFSRIASEVARVGTPFDWLVVRSGDLHDVTVGNQNFFEDMLEEALKEQDKRVSVVRRHAVGCCGAISISNIERWIRGRLGQDVEFNYLNEPRLGSVFVGYHLLMSRE